MVSLLSSFLSRSAATQTTSAPVASEPTIPEPALPQVFSNLAHDERVALRRVSRVWYGHFLALSKQTIHEAFKKARHHVVDILKRNRINTPAEIKQIERSITDAISRTDVHGAVNFPALESRGRLAFCRVLASLPNEAIKKIAFMKAVAELCQGQECDLAASFFTYPLGASRAFSPDDECKKEYVEASLKAKGVIAGKKDVSIGKEVQIARSIADADQRKNLVEQWIYQSIDRMKAAMSLFSSYCLDNPDAQTWYMRADLVRGFCTQKRFVEAAELLETITDAHAKKRASEYLACALTNAGYFPEALQLIDPLLQDPSYVWASRCRVSECLAKLGKLDMALALCNRASEYYEVAVECLKANRIDLAIEIAKKSSPESNHYAINSLIIVVKNLISKKRLDEACELALYCLSQARADRSEAIDLLITAYSETGMVEKALSLLDQAEKVTNGGWKWERPYANTLLIKALIMAKEFSKAKELASRHRYIHTSDNVAEERSQALVKLCLALIKENHQKEAFDFLAQDPRVGIHIWFIEELATLLARQGNLSLALDLINKIEYKVEYKGYEIGHISKPLTRFERAYLKTSCIVARCFQKASV